MKRFNNDRKPYRNNRFKQDFNGGWRTVKGSDPAKFDASQIVYDSFTRMTVRAFRDEEPENLIKRFRRLVENSRVLSDLRERESYQTRGQKRRDKKVAAKLRARRATREMIAKDDAHEKNSGQKKRRDDGRPQDARK